MKSYKDVVDEESSVIAEQVGEQRSRLSDRLASVRHIVAVMSGKGGVGKSTVAVNLARILAADGHAVGLVDADINGPSVAKMTGVRGENLRVTGSEVIPAVTPHGIKVMSVDLLLSGGDTPVVWEAPTQKDSYTWRSAMEAGAVREFFADTAWGSLDVLFVDLPPGADRLPTLADILPRLSGALIVTIPSNVSHHVVGKSIRLTRQQLQTPVIGLVENMVSYVCPHCAEEAPLFAGDSAEDWAPTYEIPVLGRIPFDPEFGRSNDRGDVRGRMYVEGRAGRAIAEIAERIVTFVESGSRD